MILNLLVTGSVMGLAALAPLATLIGRRLVLFGLAPLGGALIAAWSAEAELLFGGAFVVWFGGIALALNAAALGISLARSRSKQGPLQLQPSPPAGTVPTPPHGPGRTSRIGAAGAAVVPALMLGLVMLVPLFLLRIGNVAHDANAIWLFHGAWILAGHKGYLASLTSSVYAFSNPSYPPLASSAAALSGVFASSLSSRDGAAIIALLNACALYVVGLGILQVVPSPSRFNRALVSLLAMSVSLLGFAFDGPYSVAGDADLLWSAAAVAAIVYGLILPSRPQHLRVAILCVLVASFTKSEGLVAAALILVLMGVRQWVNRHPCGRSVTRRASLAHLHRGLSAGPILPKYFPLAAWIVGVGLLSGLMWFEVIHLLGVGNRFFIATSHKEPTLFRLGAVAQYLEPYLPLVLFASCVELVGSRRWLGQRQTLGLGSAWYLWIAVAGYLAALVVTYAIGGLGIRGWLDNSLGRTLVFVELCLFVQMGIWCVVGGDTLAKRLRNRQLDAGPPVQA